MEVLAGTPKYSEDTINQLGDEELVIVGGREIKNIMRCLDDDSRTDSLYLRARDLIESLATEVVLPWKF